MSKHSFRSAAGDLYEIEDSGDGNLSWDFSMCSNRVEALVAEVWGLKNTVLARDAEIERLRRKEASDA